MVFPARGGCGGRRSSKTCPSVECSPGKGRDERDRAGNAAPSGLLMRKNVKRRLQGRPVSSPGGAEAGGGWEKNRSARRIIQLPVGGKASVRLRRGIGQGWGFLVVQRSADTAANPARCWGTGTSFAATWFDGRRGRQQPLLVGAEGLGRGHRQYWEKDDRRTAPAAAARAGDPGEEVIT